jgi:hypothetical protein
MFDLFLETKNGIDTLLMEFFLMKNKKILKKILKLKALKQLTL